MNIAIYRLFDRLKYNPNYTRFPIVKATLFFLLIPSMIIAINTNIYSPIVLTFVCLIIGYRDIGTFFNVKKYKFHKLMKISIILFMISAVFSVISVKIMSYFNISDPQGISELILTDKVYFKMLTTLPFVAVGEEFLKLLVFISFFLLLVQFSNNTRIFIAIILASFIFGHLHIFNYKLTAGIPLMIGAIPSFYFMLYYKSILPLIIEHFLFDFFSLTLHTQYHEIVLVFLTSVGIIVMFWQIIKIPFDKRKSKNS
ncbi:type II CAAX prenyl endopeptidase Rce1 family protein [Gottfriedia sp. NPDC058432]|uniref:CPBP family glutamic-type intramembrane protease n=1 Tax=Gottfriedia sp. NPDC058432 TaxID=3346497 RepID=UPI003658D3A3